jgi:putative DNA primase/helicase
MAAAELVVGPKWLELPIPALRELWAPGLTLSRKYDELTREFETRLEQGSEPRDAYEAVRDSHFPGGWKSRVLGEPPVKKEVAPALVRLPVDLFIQDKHGIHADFPAFVKWFRTTDRFVIPIERGTFSTGSNFELLRYEGGYYNGMARAFIRGRTEDAFRQVGLASVDSFREEVVKGIAATSELHHRRTEFNPPDSLCLLNGVLDTRSGEIRSHTPDVVFTWKLPVAYDPTATCPRYAQFLEEVMPDEKRRELLVDLMGYCLWRENPFQLFFVMVGDGANGKTTWGNTLAALLGKDAVSTLSLQQIGSNRFAAAELEGRLVNLCDDLPYDRPLAATGVIKVLTGGGSLTVERKHQHPFELQFGGKLVSMANRTPPTQDDTYAFWRRAVVIPFEQTFPEGDPRRDPLLYGKLLAELPGILNLALKGLARVRSRQDFDPDHLFSDSEEEWRRRADPVRGELLDEFEYCPGAFVTNRRLYEWHADKCHGEDREPLNERAFGQAVTRAFPKSHAERKMVNGKNLWGRPGIRERVASPVLAALDIETAVRMVARGDVPKIPVESAHLEPATGVPRDDSWPASPEVSSHFAFVGGSQNQESYEKASPTSKTGDVQAEKAPSGQGETRPVESVAKPTTSSGEMAYGHTEKREHGKVGEPSDRELAGDQIEGSDTGRQPMCEVSAPGDGGRPHQEMEGRGVGGLVQPPVTVPGLPPREVAGGDHGNRSGGAAPPSGPAVQVSSMLAASQKGPRGRGPDGGSSEAGSVSPQPWSPSSDGVEDGNQRGTGPGAEEINSAYSDLLEALNRRGDVPFSIGDVAPWVAKRGHSIKALDAAFGRICGDGLVRRLADGRWQLRVDEEPATDLVEPMAQVALSQRERLEMIIRTAQDLQHAPAWGDGTFGVEELVAAGEKVGVPRPKTEAILQTLRNQGEVIEPRPGRFQMVRF